MEIICCLSDINRMKSYQRADGFLFGCKYSLRFKYSEAKISEIVNYCNQYNLKKYLTIDAFIMEDDLKDLKNYLEYLKTLNLDGLYFNDIGIIKLAKEVELNVPLIYDPDTLLTNKVDCSFFISKEIGVVLAREITLDEIKEIINELPNSCDVQIFGHTRMSYSKRNFLTNYFKYLGKDIDLRNKRNIKIIEEKRDYALEIMEDEFGTRIYTDYVFEMLDELSLIKDKIKRVIVEDIFLEEELISDVLNILRGQNNDLVQKYPNHTFKKGYLFTKTNKTKNE